MGDAEHDQTSYIEGDPISRVGDPGLVGFLIKIHTEVQKLRPGWGQSSEQPDESAGKESSSVFLYCFKSMHYESEIM